MSDPLASAASSVTTPVTPAERLKACIEALISLRPLDNPTKQSMQQVISELLDIMLYVQTLPAPPVALKAPAPAPATGAAPANVATT